VRRTVRLVIAIAFFPVLALTPSPRPGAAVQSVELLVNGGFESGSTDPWLTENASLSVGDPTCPPRSGGQAAALTVDMDLGYAQQTVAVAPSAEYDFSGYAFSPGAVGGTKVHVVVVWLDGDQATLNDTKWLETDPAGSGYQLLDATGTAPSLARFAWVRVDLALPFPPPPTPTTLCLDDLSFSGPPAPTPVPTSTPTPLPTATPPPTLTPAPTFTSTATLPPTLTPAPTAVPMGMGSLVNGGFEEATADGLPIAWQKFGGSLSRSSAYVRSGGYSGALRSESEATKWAYQVVGVEPGQAYEFEGYVLMDGPPGSRAYLRVSWYASADGSGETLSSVDSLGDVGGGDGSFHYLTTGAVVAPRDAHSARLRAMLAPASSSGEAVYLDDFAFFETAPPTATPAATATSSPAPSAIAGPAQQPTVAASRTATPTTVPAPMGSLVNGGFEEASADGLPIAWQKFGGDLSRSSAFARSGGYSGVLRSESEATKWAYQVVGVEPNQAYEFEGYVLMDGPPGSRAYLRVSWYASADGSGRSLSSVASTVSLSGGDPFFRHLSTGAVVAPAGASSARVRVMLAPWSAATETIYLDDFSFSPRTVPQPSSRTVADVSAAEAPGESGVAGVPPSSGAPQTDPEGRPSERTESATSPYQVKFSEVCYDTPHEGDDSAHEWVELYNADSETVDLTGWTLADNTSRDSLAGGSLAAGAFVVVAAGREFEGDYPAFDGALLFVVDGRIGNGLANKGDRLLLLDGQGRLVDALSYGDDGELLQPPAPAVAAGRCLERVPPGYDTDSAGDFRDSANPSPGFAPEMAEASESPPPVATQAVARVSGISASREVSSDSDGPPWPLILLGGLVLFTGGSVGTAAVLRVRARLGRRL
jgi:hypothetical protein